MQSILSIESILILTFLHILYPYNRHIYLLMCFSLQYFIFFDILLLFLNFQ